MGARTYLCVFVRTGSKREEGPKHWTQDRPTHVPNVDEELILVGYPELKMPPYVTNYDQAACSD